MSAVRDGLRQALRDAMRRRDRAVVQALRTALAAVDNAEAVAAPDVSGSDLAIEHGNPKGVGAAEASRRELTTADVVALIRAEIRERDAEAANYEDLGRADVAAGLRAGTAALNEVLSRAW